MNFNENDLLEGAHPLEEKNSFAEGIQLEGCPSRCPGCKHRDWSALASEKQKSDWIKRVLEPWQGVIEPLQRVEEFRRFHYRKKVCLHAEWMSGVWNFGLRVRKKPLAESLDLSATNDSHASKQSHLSFETEVIPIPNCPIQSKNIQALLDVLSQRLPSSDRLPLVYLSVSGALLTLVIKSQEIDPSLCHALVQEYDWSQWGIQGVWVNLNPSAGHRVFSPRGWRLIWGKERVQEGGFFYGPDSFQQLIPELHQHSLDQVKEFFLESHRSPGVRKSFAVMDLYSGVGRSLKEWQSFCVPTVGVELSGDAVRCLSLNVSDSLILRGKASQRIPQLNEWKESYSGVDLYAYLNPPRLGLETEITHWLTHQARPLKVAYLSCSAGTLKRDLEMFSNANYRVMRVIPYDFFPRTHHVETLVLLERKEDF